MQEADWVETISITRERYTVPGIKGHYIIEREAGGRWYDLWYTPYRHKTTNLRIQILHTDQHLKAIDAMQSHANTRILERRGIMPKETHQ